MLRIHALILAESLDCLCSFASRLKPCPIPDRSAWMWIVEPPVVIASCQLAELSTNIFQALRELHLDARPVEDWPDHRRLLMAAHRAQEAWARFLPRHNDEFHDLAPLLPSSLQSPRITQTRRPPREAHQAEDLLHEDSPMSPVTYRSTKRQR